MSLSDAYVAENEKPVFLSLQISEAVGVLFGRLLCPGRLAVGRLEIFEGSLQKAPPHTGVAAEPCNFLAGFLLLPAPFLFLCLCFFSGSSFDGLRALARDSSGDPKDTITQRAELFPFVVPELSAILTFYRLRRWLGPPSGLIAVYPLIVRLL